MPGLNSRPLWVIGSGGFLGSTLVRFASSLGFTNFPSGQVPWNNPLERKRSLQTNAVEFAAFAQGADATIIWAAGQGGVASQPRPEASEFAAFSDLVEVLTGSEALLGSQFVICSSAGGVYGGSAAPPFTVDTAPVAINAYGQEKIDIENFAESRLLPDYRLVVARITNLYGAWPGVRQGLVNRLCTAAVIREPIHIYVSLETLRDYIDVNDATQILLTEIQYRINSPTANLIDKCLVGSGRTTSVGEVIATVTNVSRRKIPISSSDLAYKDLQPKDLRVVPTWIEHGLDYLPIELPAGVKRLVDSLVTAPRWT